MDRAPPSGLPQLPGTAAGARSPGTPKSLEVLIPSSGKWFFFGGGGDKFNSKWRFLKLAPAVPVKERISEHGNFGRAQQVRTLVNQEPETGPALPDPRLASCFTALQTF